MYDRDAGGCVEMYDEYVDIQEYVFQTEWRCQMSCTGI